MEQPLNGRKYNGKIKAAKWSKPHQKKLKKKRNECERKCLSKLNLVLKHEILLPKALRTHLKKQK